jgi:L-fuconolactonase
MRIDAHQHFWRYDPAQYPWMQESWPIRRDYLPEDLTPLLSAAGLDASIAVQARQTFEESKWLLALADAAPHIAGVVGWVDLRSPQVEKQLAELDAHPKFVGVRHVVQDEPDDRFLLRADFQAGLARVYERGLVYDLLVFPRQLRAAIGLAGKFPHQKFVLDHIAKPPIRDGKISPWREDIRELAKWPNVWCKVSGMITEASWQGWKASDLRPYLDVVVEAFGPTRLMFGSDWPVCLLAGSYAQVHEIVADYSRQFTPAEQESIFGGAARAFYGLK